MAKTKRLLVLCVFIVFLFSVIRIGNVLASAEPFYLTDVEILTSSSDVEVDSFVYSDVNISNKVTFRRVGDSITYKMKIKNNTNKNYILTTIVDNNHNDCILYEYEGFQFIRIPSGEEVEFIVKAIYYTEWTDVNDRIQVNQIDLTFDYEEESDTPMFSLMMFYDGNTVDDNAVDDNTVDENVVTFGSVNETNTTNENVVTNEVNSNNVENQNNETNDNVSLRSGSGTTIRRMNGNLEEDDTVAPYSRLPQTKDNVVLYIVLACSSAIILFILLNKKDKKPVVDSRYKFNSKYQDRNISRIERMNGKNRFNNNKKKTIKLKIERKHLHHMTRLTVKNTCLILLLLLAIPISIKATTSKITTKNTFFLYSKFEVVYEVDGRETSELVDYENKVARPEDPIKDGYKFLGWYTDDGEEFNFDELIIEDIVLRARFEKETYSIGYNLNGGSIDGENPTTYTIDDEFELINPSKTGYAFTGWTGSNGNVPETNVTVSHTFGNKNYTANYTANMYTIKFDKNDSNATGEMPNQNIAYDVETELNDVAFEKEGYVLDSWNTKRDGSGTSYKNKEKLYKLLVSGSITLYAQWREAKVAQLKTGREISSKIRALAGSSTGVTSDDTNILKILKSDSIEDKYKKNNNLISVSTSEAPVYVWFEDGIIYYYSCADYIYANKDTSYMFVRLTNCTEIELDNRFKTDNVENFTQMFFRCTSLEKNDVSMFNTSKATTFASMFGENYARPSIDVSNWDTTNVQTYNFMFNQCYAMTEIDVSNFKTRNATSMHHMFSNMQNLESIDVSNFDTSNVTNMNAMFCDQPKVTSINLGNMNTSSVVNMKQMFENTNSLRTLDLSSFNTSNVTDMTKMFRNSGIRELDLSTFDTAKVKSMDDMFAGMTTVKRIYVSDKFVTTLINKSKYLFNENNNLVGGNGTAYTEGKRSVKYAVIDTPSTPGFFTDYRLKETESDEEESNNETSNDEQENTTSMNTINNTVENSVINNTLSTSNTVNTNETENNSVSANTVENTVNNVASSISSNTVSSSNSNEELDELDANISNVTYSSSNENTINNNP